MTRSYGKKHLLAAALALLGLAISPTRAGVSAAGGTSPADSIFFAKGGNIWAARLEGGLQRQITRDETALPYAYATQADNGTIEALRGTKVYHIDRRGRWLNKRFN